MFSQSTTKVVIPTDKTNSFKTVELEKYVSWMEKHLNSNAIKWSREKIREIYQDACDLLDDIEDIVSEDEHIFLRRQLT